MNINIKCPDCDSGDMGRNNLEDIQHCHKCDAYWKEKWEYNDRGYRIGTPKLEKNSGLFY